MKADDAWACWIETNGEAFFLFAKQQCRSEADAKDILQEALAEVWRRTAKGVPDRAHVFATIRRRAIDQGRSLDRRFRHEAKCAEGHKDWFVPDYSMYDLRHQLASAIESLPSTLQEVLILKVWGGLTFPAISELIEIPVATATSRYCYAIERLRVADVSKVLRNQLDLADNEGLVVEMVAKNSPAQQAKIEVGDLLLALGESPVSSPEQLSAELLNYKVGDKTKVTIMRKAKRVDLSIDLGKEPSNDVIKVPEILLENFGKGSIESVDLKTSGAGIESILENPDIPDDFKASIRAMQKKFKEFEKKTD